MYLNAALPPGPGVAVSRTHEVTLVPVAGATLPPRPISALPGATVPSDHEEVGGLKLRASKSKIREGRAGCRAWHCCDLLQRVSSMMDHESSLKYALMRVLTGFTLMI
jgi:hypothetical protein